MLYVRTGDCRRCGRCCDIHCPEFEWVALRAIKEGEVIKSGKDYGALIANCKAFDKDIQIGNCDLDQRKNFPYSPGQVPPKCGFRVIEKDADAIL